MAQTSFRCSLVTPTEKLLDEEAVYASVPSWDGSFGVLPGRAPVLARLGIGPLTLRVADSDKGQGGERSFFIAKGFVKMSADGLTILAEEAIPAERLNQTDCQAELKEAEARVVPDDAEDRTAERERIADARKAAKVKLELAAEGRSKGI
ncbi:MAG: F0F1 ATP synthase subunit epsilon [Planctomycetota bacterium]